MKKIFFAFLFFFSLLSIAQEKTKFGINTGITYSDIRGNEIANKNKYAFDFLIGTSVEIPINQKFAFLTGLNFERKSFTGEVPLDRIPFDSFDPVVDQVVNQEANIKIRATMSYLNIPLNIKYYIGKQNSFFVNGGIYTAIFINSKTDFGGNEKGVFNALDFGINLGIGKKIKLNEKVNLNIEFKNNYGLVNISKLPVYNNGTVKVNSYNLLLNWEIKI
jgi:hypothetical protein